MISVVIPLFNKQDSIRSTIESVLAQSFRDFELIVVDDGSTDGSVDVVKAINDPRIRLIEKQNGGVSSARNEGIRNASYEYVAFLDGDDLWDSDYLREIVHLIEVFPEAGILGTSYFITENKQKRIATKPLDDSFFGIVSSVWNTNNWVITNNLIC